MTKCESCGVEVSDEAEAYLHHAVHAESIGLGDPTGLRSLPFVLMPRIAKLMQDYRSGGLSQAERAAAQMLEALKLAYRKYCLDDPEVGSIELGDALLDAICEAIGDEGYQAWVEMLDLGD